MIKPSVPKFNPKKFDQSMRNSNFIKFATKKVAADALRAGKESLLKELNEHPVTVELEEGENAENISGTLDGYGNLFSFIGFHSGYNPIAPIRSAIRSIKLTNRVRHSRGSKKAVYTWYVDTNSMSALPGETRMPWEAGRSWITGIERGISGFGYYLSGVFREASRSGSGIQVKTRLRKISFKRVSYFTKMYNRFLQNLKRGGSQQGL